MSSTRLAYDSRGRLTVVVTVPSSHQPVGLRFYVVGNQVEAGGTRISFVGQQTAGRTPEQVERQTRPAGRTGGVHPWPAEYPGRARELHAQGLSCPKVAERLGVPFGTAKSWLWAESQTYEKRKQQPHRQRQAAR